MKQYYERHEIPDHILHFFKLVPYPPRPSVVLDPFMGSGTTLLVAKELGRNSVGYDLSEDYVILAKERIRMQNNNGKKH